MREQLLSHLPWFVSAVAKLPGIRRIALLGSITTDKQNPKDIDFLVVVDDDLASSRWPVWAGRSRAELNS
jgi:predicted nucleotidyltransferase